MNAVSESLAPGNEDLLRVFQQKYYRDGSLGWGPKTRLQFNYFSPDDYYEALVERLVTPGCNWADMGCGRHIFPHNPALAELLSKRCNFLLGVDPDNNIHDNPFISEAFQGLVEQCQTERRFDVITMRMVAEHVEVPDRTIGKIASLLKPGGQLVIYTPYKWAPMSFVATVVPFKWHNPLKRLIWNTESRDTFPTQYKLNTRADLKRYGEQAGLQEVHFQYLDDCRTTTAFRWLNVIELSLARGLKAIGFHYPERCVLTVYRKPL